MFLLKKIFQLTWKLFYKIIKNLFKFELKKEASEFEMEKLKIEILDKK